MTEEQGVHAETVAESQEPATQEQPNQQDVNWKAANETMAQQKQEIEQLKQRENLLLQRQQEMLQSPPPAQQAAQPANPFEGMDEQDVATVGDFQRVLSQKEQTFNQQMDSVNKQLKLMGYRSQFSDYDNVVQNTLKKAETNPALAQAIASSSDPHLLAYELGREQAQGNAKKAAEAQRMVENAQKPGSVSNAPTGGSSLSAVDYIKNLSDSEFEAKIAAVKRGG